MNLNQYFCNAERIYLMHGVLELDYIFEVAPGRYELYFRRNQNKHFDAYLFGYLSYAIWAAINGEINMRIEIEQSSTKGAMTVNEVKLTSI